MKDLLTLLIFSGIIIGSYLLGSVNTSIIISKVFFHDDIRKHGSGNAGMTNTSRTYGKIWGALTFVLDFAKAALAVYLSGLVVKFVPNCNVVLGQYTSALFVMLGHMYPIFFKFKGGKGVMMVTGAVFVIHPYIFTIALTIFLITLLCSKMVSLSSMLACVAFPATLLIYAVISNTLDNYLWFECVVSVIMAAFVIGRHWTNILRIAKGNERKIKDNSPVLFVKKNKSDEQEFVDEWDKDGK